MRFAIRRIAARFTLILAGAAVLPLLAFGFVSLLSLQRGTRESVIAGNQNVATRAAEEINRYVSSHADILKALGADLQDTDLQPWQQDRIVKNYILQFREFREITLFDDVGGTVATSRVGPTRIAIPRGSTVSVNGAAMAPVQFDEDKLPTTIFAVRLTRLNRPAGWLVGQISLEEMWRMVDRIRIGERGYALVVSADGTLIAHGDPDQKPLIALASRASGHPLMARDAPAWVEFAPEGRPTALAVAAAIPTLGWTVIVEQPTGEAYATATALERQLRIAIALALLVMIAVGLYFGRRFIAPIFALKSATQAVAAGKLDARVDIVTGDEFQDLGTSFNTMADRLVELQEDVKRKERQAMFGRIAAGLVHDLSHPIQNIGNSTRLLLRTDLDAESRELFHRTIDRELATLKRFMDDLRNLVKPKPIERFAMDVNASVSEVVESMRAEGDSAGVAVDALCRRAADDRRRSVRTGPRVPQPDHERDSGDGGGRSRHDHHGARGRSHRGDGGRHGLGYSGRAARDDLRRVRHDQAARSGTRSGHLQANRGTARRHHRRRERSRPRNRVHAPVPGP
jgi:HAMP domain-containing protein